MITEASCTYIVYGNSGSARVRVDVDMYGAIMQRYPDLNGLLEAMRVAAEGFMNKGDKR